MSGLIQNVAQDALVIAEPQNLVQLAHELTALMEEIDKQG